MPIHLSCALLSAWTRWWCCGRKAWWRRRRGERGPVAITCFSGGRVTARLSSQQGSAPGPRRSMRASDAVVKEPCGGSARVTKTSRAFAPGATITTRGETGVPPVCIPSPAGREPRWARSRSGVSPEAVSAHASMLARDPRRARSERCPRGEALVKERSDRRAPRSSILAQLGGVACPPARDPRHPVIGD